MSFYMKDRHAPLKQKVQRDDNTWWLWDLWTFLEVFGGPADPDDDVDVVLLAVAVFDEGLISPEVEWPFRSLRF